jgi:hypothetical protein
LPESAGYELFFSELEDIGGRYEVESIPCFILINDKMEIVARWQHFSEGTFAYLDSLFER